MKTKILTFLFLSLFCVVTSATARTKIDYVHVKTVYADGRVSNLCSGSVVTFYFDGDYLYRGLIISIAPGAFRFYKTENGNSVYYYYRFGSSLIAPFWQYDQAVIVSYDGETINHCYYDSWGNLDRTEVFKLSSPPASQGLIE